MDVTTSIYYVNTTCYFIELPLVYLLIYGLCIYANLEVNKIHLDFMSLQCVQLFWILLQGAHVFETMPKTSQNVWEERWPQNKLRNNLYNISIETINISKMYYPKSCRKHWNCFLFIELCTCYYLARSLSGIFLSPLVEIAILSHLNWSLNEYKLPLPTSITNKVM